MTLDARDDRGVTCRDGARAFDPSGNPSAKGVEDELVSRGSTERTENHHRQPVELARSNEDGRGHEHDFPFHNRRYKNSGVSKGTGETHVATASRTTVAIRSM